MAHRNMVGGTAYDTTGGRTMVDGTVYSIQKGKTMVDGTVREIAFGPSIVHVYLSGEGNSRNLYVKIRGTKYYDEYEFEMEAGEEITAYANYSNAGYWGIVRVWEKSGNLTTLVKSSASSSRTCTYVVPSGITELRIVFDYQTASPYTCRIDIYES